MRRVDITCSPISDLCFSRPERSPEKLAENEESRSVVKNLAFKFLAPYMLISTQSLSIQPTLYNMPPLPKKRT